MRKMFPIISTLVRSEHNPGDTFIGLGAQYLLERKLGKINWLVINKFGQAPTWESKLDLIKEAGVVLYGGMPQYNNYDDWCMWYDKEMWEEFIYPNDLKVISLAGGAGYPHAEWTPDEFTDHCICSEKTVSLLKAREDALLLTTVRDPHAHALLNFIGIENHYMPCTATFSTRHCNLTAAEDRDLVILVPPSYKSVPNIYITTMDTKEEEVRTKWLNIYKGLKKEYKNVLVVTHFYPEFLSLREHIESENLYFTSDYISLLRIYTQAKLVVSARLHGSLPAFGIPGTKVVNVAIDTRGHAAEVFKKIPTITYKDLDTDIIIEATRKAEPSEESDFDKWIKKYDRLLDGISELDKLME